MAFIHLLLLLLHWALLPSTKPNHPLQGRVSVGAATVRSWTARLCGAGGCSVFVLNLHRIGTFPSGPSKSFLRTVFSSVTIHIRCFLCCITNEISNKGIESATDFCNLLILMTCHAGAGGVDEDGRTERAVDRHPYLRPLLRQHNAAGAYHWRRLHPHHLCR